EMLERQAHDGDRDRADDDEQGHPPVRALPRLGAEQPGEEATDDPPQVLGEVDDRRDDCADLDDRGERGRPRPLDVHVEQLLEDGQVTGRAHRQEFGEPLDDAQDDGLPDGQHGYSPTPERSSASAAARRVRTPSSRLPTYSETASVVTPAAAYVRIP